AARRAGIDVEQFNNALVRGNQAMAKALTGKRTDLTSLMRKLGISFRNADGSVRNITDILPKFADAIARQTDPLLKARMASALFGRALGPEMLKLLNQGSAGIAKFIEEAEKLGLIISPEQAKIAEQYAATQRQIGNLWESMGLQINQALLPVLQQIIPIFADLLKENREAIVKGLTDAFKALGEALKNIDWQGTIKEIKAWGTWINDNIGYVGGWKVALGLLGLAMTGLLGPIATLGAAFVSFGLTLLATPVGWFLVAIAALIAGGWALYKNWDTIKEHLIGIWGAVKAAFWAAIDWLGEFVSQWVWEPIKTAWSGIAAWATQLWADVKAGFWSAIDWLGEFVSQWVWAPISNAWNGLAAWAVNLWQGVKIGFWTGINWLTEFVGKFIPDAIKNAWNGLTKWWDDLWSGIRVTIDTAWNLIKPIVDTIASAVGKVIDAVAKLPSPAGLVRQSAGLVGNALDWGKNLVTGGGGGGPSITSAGTIPQQATAVGAQQRVDVGGEMTVRFANAPPGTTVTETTRGPVAITGDVGASMAAPA
ncbi:MAG: hypothetical protein FWD12_09895, partial [Alphaproteobacteria bacterium]|nr:hypothetical protein [Alphaproteobacteria bacterium]